MRAREAQEKKRQKQQIDRLAKQVKVRSVFTGFYVRKYHIVSENLAKYSARLCLGGRTRKSKCQKKCVSDEGPTYFRNGEESDFWRY